MRQHIQQRGYADCGVACIATATNVEYERVLASVAPDVYFHGMYWGEILHALKKISNKEYSLYIEKEDIILAKVNPLCSLVLGPTILFVERDSQYADPLIKTHYVFVESGKFYDPTLTEVKDWKEITKTIVGSWKLIASIF